MPGRLCFLTWNVTGVTRASKGNGSKRFVVTKTGGYQMPLLRSQVLPNDGALCSLSVAWRRESLNKKWFKLDGRSKSSEGGLMNLSEVGGRRLCSKSQSKFLNVGCVDKQRNVNICIEKSPENIFGCTKLCCENSQRLWRQCLCRE